jgi:hypothetical protein
MNGIHEVTGSIPVWSTTSNPRTFAEFQPHNAIEMHGRHEVTRAAHVRFGAFSWLAKGNSLAAE